VIQAENGREYRTKCAYFRELTYGGGTRKVEAGQRVRWQMRGERGKLLQNDGGKNATPLMVIAEIIDFEVSQC
jgi:hypothetical protein